MEYEIYHWGIKGMKWGIRRYQNKDGSLTAAGKRRLKKESDALKREEAVLKNRKSTKAKFDRLTAKRKSIEEQKKALDDDETKKSNADDAKPTKKSVKDMTDDELFSAIRRAQMEKQYETLTAQPETVKKGNTFVKDFMDKAAVPALQEAGKALIRDSLLKAGKKYLGLESQNADSYIDKLGKEVKKMTLEKQYKKLKEEIETEKDAADKKASEKSKSEDNNNTKTSDTKSTGKKTKEKVFEGTVEGVGNSSKTTNEGRKWTNEDTVIDAEWYEVVNPNNTSSGRSYVSDYLELPAPKADDD